MKILYGIQGTGNGHLARARALVPELRKQGLELDFVFSGRAKDDYFDMEVFGNHCRFFDGLTFVTEQGRLKKFKTLFNNNLIRFANNISTLNVQDYDLVISDFEPITAWAARIKKIPSIGISHQCAFDFAVPKLSGHHLERLLMRYFAPTHQRIGLHWHHFGYPILPPIIKTHTAQPIIENKIVVYMGFEPLEDVIRFVSGFSDYAFHIYAKVDTPQSLGHVTIHPLNHDNFHQDLSDCAGVISNAGFELSSECIALGKKLLIKPLNGQYEQMCNALALQQLQRATIIDSFDQKILTQWLAADPHKAMTYPNVSEAIAQWIQAGVWDDTQSLMDQLWQGACDKEVNSNLPSHIEMGVIY
ncbi:MAG: glycosyltransferase [Cellvibrionales bacterium]|nr:glycosyltransferase [Cellvibrionales bacterium]